jgi:hypothetical protein
MTRKKQEIRKQPSLFMQRVLQAPANSGAAFAENFILKQDTGTVLY